MPICNGIEATIEIRKILVESEYQIIKQPYICGISSTTEPNFQKAAIEAGMDSLLSKPIFKNAMQNLLTKVSLHRQQSKRW